MKNLLYVVLSCLICFIAFQIVGCAEDSPAVQEVDTIEGNEDDDSSDDSCADSNEGNEDYDSSDDSCADTNEGNEDDDSSDDSCADSNDDPYADIKKELVRVWSNFEVLDNWGDDVTYHCLTFYKDSTGLATYLYRRTEGNEHMHYRSVTTTVKTDSLLFKYRFLGQRNIEVEINEKGSVQKGEYSFRLDSNPEYQYKLIQTQHVSGYHNSILLNTFYSYPEDTIR